MSISPVSGGSGDYYAQLLSNASASSQVSGSSNDTTSDWWASLSGSSSASDSLDSLAASTGLSTQEFQALSPMESANYLNQQAMLSAFGSGDDDSGGGLDSLYSGIADKYASLLPNGQAKSTTTGTSGVDLSF
ncbi:hypothetical protein ACIB24_20140 [Spongisporangium articulatum]|uniref:Uncharacterized protein n=1 Tax=Spongisporangium articulatum TaxID=3362603 RepID=A0ABW8ASM8_9ACTN